MNNIKIDYTNIPRDLLIEQLDIREAALTAMRVQLKTCTELIEAMNRRNDEAKKQVLSIILTI